MKILCWAGLHDFKSTDLWLPSFHAKIVREFIQEIKCAECGKVKNVASFKFDETGKPINENVQ